MAGALKYAPSAKCPGRAGVRAGEILVACLLAAAFLLSGCSNDIFTGQQPPNQIPNVYLTNGPIEGETTKYRVHFFWIGDDPDGTVLYYEYVMIDGDPIGFNPDDTTGTDKWTRTVLTDKMFTASADEYDSTVVINNNLYTKFQKTHTLFVRAVDDRGGVSKTEYRSFNAWTFAPAVFITYPVPPTPAGSTQMLSLITTFKWYGKDPINSPWNYQAVDSIRYLYTTYNYTSLRMLNESPELFEPLWSPWYSYECEGDSGKTTVIGDDEVLSPGITHMFVVQAKDEAGAVSAIFDAGTNVRVFLPQVPTGPLLRIKDPYLGIFSFIGTNLNRQVVDIPPGFELNFSWTGDASGYGATVAYYRYGWDVEDVNEPKAWSVSPSPYILSAPSYIFYSGIHTLYVESVDVLGTVTLGILELRVIPALMARDLLWVDDFPSSNFSQEVFAFPTEEEHDDFWEAICVQAPTFVPSRDIYDVNDNGHAAPTIRHLWKYKNVIWTYSTAINQFSGSIWNSVVLFTPDYLVNPSSPRTINFLSYYMACGGHLWTLGDSRRNGGLAAVVPPWSQQFPLYVKRQAYPDTVGAQTMAYYDYCVNILDKMEGIFRVGPEYPRRDIERDAMAYGYLDRQDPITAQCPDFPKKLVLWDQVTLPGRFFDPQVRGFFYAECYDPAYWMEYNNLSSQSCFHPIYRMRARNSRSCLDHTVVAFWTTKYADVLAESEGAVAAPSIQFGLPLWFFNRAQVDSISTAIFKMWNIY
ncbi:MAG: hypothetical protein JXB45_07110 [Candidatus Krumholzibacteriota bacterium]|nr:hypothetical protein [Candidatus Krumholzibacteriota bacterium]